MGSDLKALVAEAQATGTLAGLPDHHFIGGAFVPAVQHDFGVCDPVIGGGSTLKWAGSDPVGEFVCDRLPSPARSTQWQGV